MKWKQLVFEKEVQVRENRESLNSVLNSIDSLFIDREYSGRHKLRLRGICADDTQDSRLLAEILGTNLEYHIQDDRPEELFQNEEQFELHYQIHHNLDKLWFPYYFTGEKPLEEILAATKALAEELTVTRDEGYNSHLSHFLGFFYSLERKQKDAIAKIFQMRYERVRYILPKKCIEISRHLTKIRRMIEQNKLDFYSPQDRTSIIDKGQFASKLHEKTLRSAEQQEFCHCPYSVCNRWLLNALYVSMILMDIPVIDRFFVNYAVAMEKYPVDEICEVYLRTGEEKVWLRKGCA